MEKRTQIAVGGAALAMLATCSCCCFMGLLGSGAPDSPPPPTPTPLAAPGAGVLLAQPSGGPTPTQPTHVAAVEPQEPPDGVRGEEAAEATPGDVRSIEPDAGNCGSSALPEFQRQALVEITPQVTPDGSVLLWLRTNLPAGTILMTSVSGNGYMGQARVSYTGQCMAAGPFSQRGQRIPAGRYTATASTPFAAIHPAEVQAVIGDHGQNLRGRDVERRGSQRLLEATRRFEVGSAAEQRAVQQGQARDAARERELISRYERLVERGRGMEALRHSDALGTLRACGDEMRRNQAAVDALRRDAEAAGADMLARSVGSLNLCVSCVDDARSWCTTASQNLRDIR